MRNFSFSLLVAAAALFFFCLTARAATPTMVQSVSHPVTGVTIAYWKMNLPDPTLAGNALVLGCSWGSGSNGLTVADDKSNAWKSGPVAQDGGNNESAQTFYAVNIASGTRLITVTPSGGAAYVQCVASEWYNISTVSSTVLDASSSAVTATVGAIAAGNVSTTVDGDLVFQYALADNFSRPSKPWIWTASSGLALLTADGTSPAATQYEVQAAHGAVNPSLSITPNITSGVTSAIALKAATAGTAPASSGIRVVSVQVIDGSTGNLSAIPQKMTVQAPTTGNLLAMVWNGNTPSTPTNVTSSNVGSWSHTAASTTNQDTIWIWYAASSTASATTTITVTHAAVPSYPLLTFYDITGASSTPFDTYATSTGSLNATSGVVTGPSITPGAANELVIGGIEESGETVTAVSTGYFDAVQTDQYENLSLDQDAGFMHYYNTTTSTVNVNWTYSYLEGGSTNVGNWQSQLAAFRAAPAVVINNATGSFAWGDRAGWVNFSTGLGGFAVTASTLTGYAWSQNFGWVNFAPSGSGVTNDGLGNLQGYAWSENAGWYNFSGVTISSTGTFVGTATAVLASSAALAGNIYFGCSYCLVTTTWRASSPSVTVSNVQINGGSSTITLTSATTTPITITASTTDSAGGITYATSTFYLTSLGQGCTANNFNCYQISSSSCSFSGSSSSTVTCTANVWYFAASTGVASSTYSGDSWTAAVTVVDSGANTGTGLTSPVVNVGVLSAVSVSSTASINYGSLAAGSNTSSTNQTSTIQNAGNSSTSLQVYGTALTNGASIVATGSQQYATSSFTYGVGSTGTALTDTAVLVPGFVLAAPTTTSAISSIMYWGLQIASGTSAGTYNGVNTLVGLWHQ